MSMSRRSRGGDNVYTSPQFLLEISSGVWGQTAPRGYVMRGRRVGVILVGLEGGAGGLAPLPRRVRDRNASHRGGFSGLSQRRGPKLRFSTTRAFRFSTDRR